MKRLFAMQIASRSPSAGRRTLRRFAANREDGAAGVAAIEFAVLAPILLLMFVCIADLALGIQRKTQVQEAAQVGAAYAIAHGFSSTGIVSAVTNATGSANISASPAPSQFCGCPASTGVTVASCNSTCSGGALAGSYVTVSTSGSYQTLLPYPLIPNQFTFSSQATVRIL